MMRDHVLRSEIVGRKTLFINDVMRHFTSDSSVCKGDTRVPNATETQRCWEKVDEQGTLWTQPAGGGGGVNLQRFSFSIPSSRPELEDHCVYRPGIREYQASQ